MNVRIAPLALGVLTFFGAIAVLVGVARVTTTRPVVTIVGALVLLAATRSLTRRPNVRDRTPTPDPEHRNQVPVPGASLKRTLEHFRGRSYGYDVTSRHVVDGLRGAAIAVLTRFGGLSRDEAERRVEEGTWTDDPRVAGFLSERADAPAESLRDRIAIRLSGETTFRARTRRAAAAVAAVGYAGIGERTRSEEPPQYDPERVENVVPRTADESVHEPVERRRRSTEHWTGVGIVALVAAGLGAAAQSPAVVLAGVVGIGYAGFARATEAPTIDLGVDRTLSDESPEPGDEVDVTVTITNESGAFVPDLRYVDGVPAALAVTEGSARIGTALRPGESVTLEYTLTARRGSHRFDPAQAIVRDLSRSSEREVLVPGETVLVCEPVVRPTAAPVPLRPAAATFSGRLTTADGGAGTEFHSVREYRKNDPLNRIDWNRHARTGELATLQFHEERAARVLILVDARKEAYLAPEPDAAHAVDRSVAAAGAIAASLLADGDTVGLAALGPVDRDDGTDPDASEPCWLAPGSGQHHEGRFRELLATHPQFSSIPPESSILSTRQLRRIRRRLSADTQVVLLTPLCDRQSTDVARRLDAHGHGVTVISPDPTAERTTSQQLARVARRIRRFDLQRAGIPVVDWRADEPVDEAFARTNAGDRR